jgi:hypothetical protein
MLIVGGVWGYDMRRMKVVKTNEMELQSDLYKTWLSAPSISLYATSELKPESSPFGVSGRQSQGGKREEPGRIKSRKWESGIVNEMRRVRDDEDEAIKEGTETCNQSPTGTTFNLYHRRIFFVSSQLTHIDTSI